MINIPLANTSMMYIDVHSCTTMQVVKMLSEKGETERHRFDSEPKNNLNAENVGAFYRFDFCNFLFDPYKVIE